MIDHYAEAERLLAEAEESTHAREVDAKIRAAGVHAQLAGLIAPDEVGLFPPLQVDWNEILGAASQAWKHGGAPGLPDLVEFLGYLGVPVVDQKPRDPDAEADPS